MYYVEISQGGKSRDDIPGNNTELLYINNTIIVFTSDW